MSKKVMENYMQYRRPLKVDIFVFIATKFIGLLTKVSNVHYLPIAIYPHVKIEMYSFNTF